MSGARVGRNVRPYPRLAGGAKILLVVKLLRLVLWPAAFAVGGATAALIASGGIADSPALTAAVGLLVGLSWCMIGLEARRRRPANRTGVLMVFFGFAWFASLWTYSRRRLVRRVPRDRDRHAGASVHAGDDVRRPLRPLDGLRGVPPLEDPRGVPQPRRDRPGDRGGVAKTARVITAAAAIMVSVFLALAVSDEIFLTLLGVGMAAAIFLDATVVRMVLVPALMQIVGRANWWIPDWLDRRLPRLEPVVMRGKG